MARNRRNKRDKKQKKVEEVVSSKAFFIMSAILIFIIIICTITISHRNHQERLLLAKQREKLEKEIEAIFTETAENIANSNHARDTIIRISAVGDILCGKEMLDDAYQKEFNIYNFVPMFENITSFIEGSDVTLGTMETNFTDNEYSGYGNRNSPKEFAQAVKDSGIDLVSISTNHSLDYGIEGLKTTKDYLQELGFYTVGDNLGENRVLIQDIKDTKIAFLSYTYAVEKQDSKSKEELDSINIFSEETVKQDLEYAKENADYIIVIMHWGNPYATKQSAQQQKIANFLVENGADTILGNHPAVIQPMEVRQNSEGENVFIAYSLGNYSSSISNDNSKVEFVLNIDLRKRGEDGKVVLSKVDYTPIYVLDNGTKAENRYELIDMKGTAKAYANGNTQVIDKKTYKKLIEGLELLEEVVGRTEN